MDPAGLDAESFGDVRLGAQREFDRGLAHATFRSGANPCPLGRAAYWFDLNSTFLAAAVQEYDQLDGFLRVFRHFWRLAPRGAELKDYAFRMICLKSRFEGGTPWNIDAGGDHALPVQRRPAALAGVHDVVDFLVVELGRHCRRPCA